MSDVRRRPAARQGLSGLTLVELMIVVAILGLLGSIAYSFYRSYVMQARVSTGIAVANGIKSTMAEAMMMGEADLPFVEPVFDPSPGVTCVAPWIYRSAADASCDSVHIDIVFDPGWVPSKTGRGVDSRIVIQGKVRGAVIDWECGVHFWKNHRLADPSYYPSGCRTETSADAGRFSCMAGEPARRARQCTQR